jgi:hypothetical protein
MGVCMDRIRPRKATTQTASSLHPSSRFVHGSEYNRTRALCLRMELPALKPVGQIAPDLHDKYPKRVPRRGAESRFA